MWQSQFLNFSIRPTGGRERVSRKLLKYSGSSNIGSVQLSDKDLAPIYLLVTGGTRNQRSFRTHVSSNPSIGRTPFGNANRFLGGTGHLFFKLWFASPLRAFHFRCRRSIALPLSGRSGLHRSRGKEVWHTFFRARSSGFKQICHPDRSEAQGTCCFFCPSDPTAPNKSRHPPFCHPERSRGICGIPFPLATSKGPGYARTYSTVAACESTARYTAQTSARVGKAHAS